MPMYWIFISLLLILFVVYAAMLIIYRSGFIKTPVFKLAADVILSNIKVSIIIPARNEAANIEQCLQSILANNYPNELLEIIVVDDHSTDDTADIAKNCSPLIKVINLSKYINEPINSYKKMAIEIAVKESSGDLIVCTDADCIVPNSWLQTIVSFYNLNNSVFIAMPVILSSKNRFIENFQVVDFMVLQGITVGAVNSSLHPMCNGANLAYTKNAFLSVNGFAGISNIASGDDMLLMQKIMAAFPGRVHYLKSKEVFVSTPAMPTVKNFLQQRIRWASKAGFYKNISLNVVLAIVYAFNLFLLVTPLVSLFYNPLLIAFSSGFSITLIKLWLCLFVGKIIIDTWFMYPVSNFFNKKNLLPFFILAQPFHIIYTVVAGWLGKFGNYHWKGRRVK